MSQPRDPGGAPATRSPLLKTAPRHAVGQAGSGPAWGSAPLSPPGEPGTIGHMTTFGDEYRAPLAAAGRIAQAWLDGVPDRPIPPRADIDEVKDALGRDLPVGSTDAAAVIELLAGAVEPGLMAMQSPRFYGWVIGGTYPAALAADWLVSTWDQNSPMRGVTPGVAAAEELAGDWLTEMLGLPASAALGFATAATTANLIALTAARDQVLRGAGGDPARDGIQGGPRVRVLVGEERHASIDVALRYLGLGTPEVVASDDQGRIYVDRLADAVADEEGPAIVCLQAGDLHSGAFDDFGPAVAVAHDAGAWVHVDGAFGLWAAASTRYRHLTAGVADADSWATDAHKTLNVPYDCGVVAVRDPAALAAAMQMHAAYLPSSQGADLDMGDRVLELSRRARGVPTWAALRALGSDGVARLVDGLADGAASLAEGLAGLDGVSVINDVVFTQVCATFDEASVAVVSQRLDAEGRVLAHPSHWRGRDVLRFSVSNRATDAAAIAETVDAVRRALAG